MQTLVGCKHGYLIYSLVKTGLVGPGEFVPLSTEAGRPPHLGQYLPWKILLTFSRLE